MQSWRFIRFGAVATVALVLTALGVSTSAAAEADTTPPVLVAVSFSPESATPGTTVTATVAATDNVGIAYVNVWTYEESSGRDQRWLNDAGDDPLIQSRTVDASWANGTHRIFAVEVWDAAGNSAWYHRSGSYSTRPPSATRTHDLDLTTPGFTVSGASDLSPPALTSFAVTSPATRAGEPVTVAWSAVDAQSEVAAVTAHWSGVDSSSGLLAPDHSPAAAGSVIATFPAGGRWQLYGIEVVDTLGNSAWYRPDGTISSGNGASAVVRAHALDLASVSLALAPTAPRTEVVARPGRLTVLLPASENVTGVVSSYRLVAEPGGVVKEVTPSPNLPDGWMSVDLTGLPNGPQQTVEVVAKSQWGDSLPSRVTGRPQLSSNVVGLPDVTGDGRPDVVAQRQYGASSDARVQVYRGTGRGGLRSATVFRTGNWDHCHSLGAFSYRYWGEGKPLCRTDRLTAMDPAADEELGARGWSSMRFVDGGYDLNGDRTGDVIAVDPSGVLRLYAQTTRGRLVAWPRMGTGLQSMISVVSAGDLNGDKRNDIVAADAAGRLWLYPGNGKGGVTTRRQIGSGWQAMGALLPLRDFDGDGRADLGGITLGGDLRLYRGTGTGTVRAGIVIGTGWQRYL